MPTTREDTVQIGEDWSNEVKEFLESYGFEKINGGHDFCPGGFRNQIDLVACTDGTLFIIECKTKSELGSRSLRGEIQKFLTKARKAKLALIRGYPNNKYIKYKNFKFVFATNNIVWNCNDLVDDSENELEEDLENNVLRWDNQFFDYYNALMKNLGKYASRFQLLGELKVFSGRCGKTEIPAIKTTINNKEMYHFVISPLKLVKMCCVARREFAKTEYYQRMIDGGRLDRIISYLDNDKRPPFPNGRLIPGNIIMCTHHGPHESPLDWKASNTSEINLPQNTEIGTLTIEEKYRSLWVIDGQHRFFSFFKIENRAPQPHDKILVTVIEDLKLSQQRDIFIDVNQKQVKIAKEYLIDMYGDINPNNEEGKMSNTIKIINRMENIRFSRNRLEPNLFYYKIKIPSHGAMSKGIRKPYSLVGFFNALKKFELMNKTTSSSLTGANNNPFYHSDERRLVSGLAKGICDFFVVLRTVLGETDFYNKLTVGGDTNGHLYITLGLFERILSAYVKEFGRSKPGLGDYNKYLSKFKQYLSAIKPIEYAKIINTSGDKNRINTIKIFCSGLKGLEASGFKYFQDLNPGLNELKLELIDFEKIIRDFVNTKITVSGNENWCTGKRPDLFPGKVLQKILKESPLTTKIKNLKARGIEWDPKNNYVGMTLNETFDIIKKSNNWNLFEPIFLREFTTKESFISSFIHVKAVRNKLIHSEGPDALKTPQNISICKTQLQQFYKCITEEEIFEEPENFGEEEIISEEE